MKNLAAQQVLVVKDLEHLLVVKHLTHNQINLGQTVITLADQLSQDLGDQLGVINQTLALQHAPVKKKKRKVIKRTTQQRKVNKPVVNKKKADTSKS